MVNSRGEVIGVTYYDFHSTECMPINIAWKWWQHYKKFRYLQVVYNLILQNDLRLSIIFGLVS